MTNTTSNGDGVLSVRTEHDDKSKETYDLRRREAEEINEFADQLVLRHKEFIRLGRQVLDV